MLEVPATILDIVQGEIRHIVIGDSVYETRYIGLLNEVGYAVQEAEEAEEKQEQIEQPEEPVFVGMEEANVLIDLAEPQQPKLGAFIKNVSDVPLFENPLFEFRNIKSRADGIKIIREFFPYINNAQVTKYTATYLEQINRPRHRIDLGSVVFKTNGVTGYSLLVDRMKKGEMVERVIREYYPHIQYRSVLSYARKYKEYLNGTLSENKMRQPRKQRYTIKSDILGKSKKYHRNINKDDYNKVKLSLNKFNFVATTNNISSETKLTPQHVLAILDYMKEQGEIKKVNKDNNLIIYELI